MPSRPGLAGDPGTACIGAAVVVVLAGAVLQGGGGGGGGGIRADKQLLSQRLVVPFPQGGTPPRVCVCKAANGGQRAAAALTMAAVGSLSAAHCMTVMAVSISAVPPAWDAAHEGPGQNLHAGLGAHAC